MVLKHRNILRTIEFIRHMAAADRRRGINEQIFGQPGGSLFPSGGYNILVIRIVRYFAE